MQKDMHYYSIFFLCMAAGFNPEDAFKTAFSSQYVDDSKCSNSVTIRCTDGDIEEFRPVKTAHNGFKSFEEGVQEEIYFPFHFLPGLKNGNYEEMIVTKAGYKGELFELLLENAREDKKNFIKLGINLHVLADTFSHEGFSGHWSIINNINKVTFIPVKKNWPSALLSKIWWKFRSKTIFSLAPAIGHGRAGVLPDVPHLCWSYKNLSGQMRMVSNNLKFFNGLLLIYENLLCKVSTGNPVLTIQEVKSILWEAVFYNSRLNKRCKFWKNKIVKHFNPDQHTLSNYLSYKSDRWLKEIGLKWTGFIFKKQTIKLRITIDDFINSKIYNFFKECQAHKKYVLKELRKRLSGSLEKTEGIFVNNIQESLKRQERQSY